LPGAPTNGAFTDGEAVWSWHPLLVSSCRRRSRLNRVRPALILQRRWQDEFVAGESAEETVKTIARETLALFRW